MSINLVTYANQTVTPTNDAIIYEKAVDQNGIFYGCNVTVTSNTVNITGGYGIVCGREFVINSESITVTLAPSGTLQGRLYVRLDLADADAPIRLLTVTGNTLPALTQDDDVNYTNGVYEMELATFTVGVSALSDVVETFEIITGTKVQFTDSAWKSTSAYQSRISDNLVRYVKIGSIVFVSGRFYAETASSSGTPIATGLPSPVSSTGAPLSGCNSSATTNVPFGVTQYGSLAPLTTLTAGTYYAVGGVYFTRD